MNTENRDKDLLGRDELIGGASGKQGMFLDPADYRQPPKDAEGQTKIQFKKGTKIWKQ